jgi:hypothetical protein
MTTQPNPVVALIKEWIAKDTAHLEELKARLEAINSGQIELNTSEPDSRPEVVQKWITCAEEILAWDYQELERVLAEENTGAQAPAGK